MKNPPRFTGCTRAFSAGEAGCTCMDECCATSHLIDALEIDDQVAGIFSRVCHNLGTEQGDYMVRDDLL